MVNQILKVFSRTCWWLLLVAILGFACSGGRIAPTVTITPTPTRTPTPTPALSGGGGLAYRVFGESNQVSFSGEICNLNKPFFIDGTFPGGTARTSFTPSSALDGETSMSGGGGGCTQSGEGTYTVVINADGSGTITWTDEATLTCTAMSNDRITTFEVSLEPAPDLLCP